MYLVWDVRLMLLFLGLRIETSVRGGVPTMLRQLNHAAVLQL